jgi:isocitrate dehydrogenase
MYWARAVAEQTEDSELAAKFVKLAQDLVENKEKILEEMGAVQGQPADLGGYYHPSAELVETIMRPSSTFNALLGEALRSFD